MEIAVRGNVLVAAKVENLGDVLNCARGLFGPELVKAVALSGVSSPRNVCFALPSPVRQAAPPYAARHAQGPPPKPARVFRRVRTRPPFRCWTATAAWT